LLIWILYYSLRHFLLLVKAISQPATADLEHQPSLSAQPGYLPTNVKVKGKVFPEPIV
jgi:hypothetical protein